MNAAMPGARFAALAAITLAAALLAWQLFRTGAGMMARYREHFTERTRFQAQEFFLFIDPRQLFLANLGVMLAGALAAWLASGSLVWSLPALVLLALLPRLLYAAMRRRRLRRFEEQLPDALMMLCGGLRAGVGMTAAMQQLVAEAEAPLAQEFTLLLREGRLGVALEQSLSNLARRMPTQTTILVVSAMRIAGETGGGLAETLERTAHTIRSRLQMEGKIRALTAQGKLQAWVVSLLPLLLMLILDRMEPQAMSHLWHSHLGWAVLAAIGILELFGVLVIRRIVAIDV
jgi:tight adherence protein B